MTLLWAIIALLIGSLLIGLALNWKWGHSSSKAVRDACLVLFGGLVFGGSFFLYALFAGNYRGKDGRNNRQSLEIVIVGQRPTPGNAVVQKFQQTVKVDYVTDALVGDVVALVLTVSGNQPASNEMVLASAGPEVQLTTAKPCGVSDAAHTYACGMPTNSGYVFEWESAPQHPGLHKYSFVIPSGILPILTDDSWSACIIEKGECFIALSAQKNNKVYSEFDEVILSAQESRIAVTSQVVQKIDIADMTLRIWAIAVPLLASVLGSGFIWRFFPDRSTRPLSNVGDPLNPVH